jgi:hypothetical protein
MPVSVTHLDGHHCTDSSNVMLACEPLLITHTSWSRGAELLEGQVASRVYYTEANSSTREASGYKRKGEAGDQNWILSTSVCHEINLFMCFLLICSTCLCISPKKRCYRWGIIPNNCLSHQHSLLTLKYRILRNNSILDGKHIWEDFTSIWYFIDQFISPLQ